MANINSKTEQVIEPQILAADTPNYNNAGSLMTAVPMEFQGRPVVSVSVGKLGVGTSALSLSAYTTTAMGVTPTALSMGGATTSSIPLRQGVYGVNIDQALEAVDKLILGLESVDGTAAVAVNVIRPATGTADSDSKGV